MYLYKRQGLESQISWGPVYLLLWPEGQYIYFWWPVGQYVYCWWPEGQYIFCWWPEGQYISCWWPEGQYIYCWWPEGQYIYCWWPGEALGLVRTFVFGQWICRPEKKYKILIIRKTCFAAKYDKCKNVNKCTQSSSKCWETIKTNKNYEPPNITKSVSGW